MTSRVTKLPIPFVSITNIRVHVTQTCHGLLGRRPLPFVGPHHGPLETFRPSIHSCIMPKAEKGSVKDIGKRIKAKGLQKLKFWCEMCQKQCRDANGFKCHLTSDSHLRQMKIFSEHAGSVMSSKSREFEKTFVDTLRMRHTTQEVNANNVYQEVIRDKQHVHMNATMWASLSDFVKYLGKKGVCVVKETERGWYIKYIEQDVGKIERQAALQRRQEAEKEAEKALEERLEHQRVEAAKALDRALGEDATCEATKLDRSSDTAVQVTLSKKEPKNKSASSKPSVFGDDGDQDDEEDEGPPTVPIPSNLARTAEESTRKRHADADDLRSSKKSKSTWLYRDIIVRIVDKRSVMFKRKAVVDKVRDNGTAAVSVLDSGPDADDGGQVLDVDDKQVETVVGKVGKLVRIVHGPDRGQKATILELDKDKSRAVLQLVKTGDILKKVHFDDFSKIA